MMRGLQGLLRHAMRQVVDVGLPPSLIGWRHVRRSTPKAYLERPGPAGAVSEIHAPAVATSPLPRNIDGPERLDADPGWWGFSFRDVPQRKSGPTRLFRIQDASIVTYGGPGESEKFHPAVLSRDGRALEIDQTVYRPPHGAILRRAGPRRTIDRGTWIVERVYDNHSHWLTAHLPKLVLLRDRGAAGDVLMPERRTAVMDASLHMLGLDPAAFPTFPPNCAFTVRDLVLVEADRFRPEMLRPVREALAPRRRAAPGRRIFVSRGRSQGRRLLGEEDLWEALDRRGFVRVYLEEHDFAAQVHLMSEAAVVVAPHGAGLTNVLFCPEGSHVVEIADRAYPNPNFYALAAAMGLKYWLVPASGVGGGHPLMQDLSVEHGNALAVVDRALREARDHLPRSHAWGA
jgi:hypothetical protein